jgi:hypothetical protein
LQRKIEKLSADFANALMSAQIRQTVCYAAAVFFIDSSNTAFRIHWIIGFSFQLEMYYIYKIKTMIMTLLTIWDGITGIFGFIICIGVLLLLYKVIASIMNVKIVSRTGTVLAKPQDLGNIKKSITNTTKSIIDRIRFREEKVDKIMSEIFTSKIDRLERLAKLKDAMYITDNEYEILKKEILG